MTDRVLPVVTAAALFASGIPTSWSDEAALQASLATRNRFGDLGILSTNNFDTGTSNGFFASLGRNGRTCASCHVHDQAETLTPHHARRVAAATPHDPLFAPVDGSDCPPLTPDQVADARHSSLLLRFGVIRVQLAVPVGADFSLAGATNPQNCTIAPGDAAIRNELFLFRRPLPTSNLSFLSSVMWDGRETHHQINTGLSLTSMEALVSNLASQADAATLGHAQGARSINASKAQADILAFERNLFTAQLRLGNVDLTPSNGGPAYLAQSVAPAFFIGQNDPLGNDFTSTVFTLYQSWEPDQVPPARGIKAAIGRGERIFNTKTFTIANVAGLNSASGDPLYNPSDPLANTPITGTCGTCHNTINVGNHSTSLPINIGATMAVPTDNNGKPIDHILDTAHLPVYTLVGSGGTTVRVTDPGRALISGRWFDIGKTKGPNLRGLAARAPYFHNGSAKDLRTVLDFYNARFNIGLTAKEIADLVVFLAAL
ncbi:MAG TPA: hypothetical protein VFB54_05345 [Burkholderiales bacterium]|nr:hypothetical protein [Burkholderiales bacterium]